MSTDRGRRSGSGTHVEDSSHARRVPGRSTLTSRIQRRAAAAPVSAPSAPTDPIASAAAGGEAFVDPFALHLLDHSPSAPLVQRLEQVHAHAAAGVQGAGGPLPHADRIKESFGAHASVVDGIQAHVGGAAADASKAIGAEAYATGNAVAFQSAPDLFTAAHEAAHVVQQRAGVQLLGGVGEVGDVYERNADEVAAKVVRGESAEQLLAQGRDGAETEGIQLLGANGVVQRKVSKRIDRDARKHIALSYRGLETQLAVGQKLQGRVAAGERPLAEIEAFRHAAEYLKADLAHWADVLEGATSAVAGEWREKTSKLTAKVELVLTWLNGVVGTSAAAPASPGGTAAPAASPPTTPATPSPVAPGVAPVPPAVAGGTAAGAPPKKPAATGYPEVDSDICADPAMAASQGKVCDQPPVGRATLIGAVRADVEHGFGNFRDALSHAQLEIMLEKEKSWSPVVDFLVLVMTFPLQPYAAAAYAAAKVEVVAISGKAIENAVKSGVALVSAELKAAAGRLPATRDGKVAFLQILKEKTDALATFMMHGAVSSLDDRELPVFGHAFAAHNTLAGCAARVAEILARYDAQVASVGELRAPNGPLSGVVHAAARIQHNGKERVALIHSRDLREWTFERWVDADMAEMALKATEKYEPGLIGPFSAEGGPDQPATADMLSRPTAFFSPTFGLVKGVFEWDHTP